MVPLRIRAVWVVLVCCACGATKPASPTQVAPQLSACAEIPPGHVVRSSPLVQAWRQLDVGSPVHALDDVAGVDGWLDAALVQRIDVQAGTWFVRIEPGYSVFRLYPYLSPCMRPDAYQGIVLKVPGDLSAQDLRDSIRNRAALLKIDELELFGTDGVYVRKRSSRPRVSTFRRAW